MKNESSNSFPPRNPGTPLDMSLIRHIQVNRSAVERRASTIAKRRSLKKEWQAAWLLKAISCMDLTTLAGDDTATNVLRLCAKAKQPIHSNLQASLGIKELGIQTAAVCVYHTWIETALAAVAGTGIAVAAVSTGFPAGQIPLELKLAQVEAAVAAGAQEIDIVISRNLVLGGQWQALYEEVKAYRKACGESHLKTILATGELANFRQIAQASQVCMMAGADFIKTSTGKEKVNATLAVSLVMLRAIRDYHEKTGFQIGFKPAGGIRTAKDALAYLILMKEELGNEWLQPALFRFGASSLLTDIERQLAHFATGRYAAGYRQPMG